MKRNLLLMLAVFAMMSAGCEKDLQISDFDFDVKSINSAGAETSIYTLGDTISFNLIGNPDQVTFYSGQVGSRYDFRERVIADGSARLQFSTVKSGNASAIGLPNTLSLLVSDDFKGVVNKTAWEVVTRDTAASSANIAAANWKDITDRAVLSNGANGAAVQSGIVDLSDFAAANKPVYVAFRYQAPTDVLQPKWVVSSFEIRNILSDGTSYLISNFNGPTAAITNYGNTSYASGWTTSSDPKVNLNKNIGWIYNPVGATGNPQRIEITGATTVGAAKAAEAWAIVGPIQLKRVTPDAGTAIKTIVNRLPKYVVPKVNNYTVAGQYKAVFVASSHAPGQVSAKVKQLTLTIKP